MAVCSPACSYAFLASSFFRATAYIPLSHHNNMDGDIIHLPVPFNLPPADGPTARAVISVQVQSSAPQADHRQTVGDNSPADVATEDDMGTYILSVPHAKLLLLINMTDTVYLSPPSSNDRISTPTQHSTIAETELREAHVFFEGQDRPRTYGITNDPRTLPSIRTLVAHAFDQDVADLPTNDSILASTVVGSMPYPVPTNAARRQPIRHIFNARAWSWASVTATFTFLSSIPSLALLIASHVASWPPSAQKGLLFWFVLSVVILFTSIIVLAGLSGKLAEAGKRIRRFYGGAGMARSQGQGVEEGYQLQNLDMGDRSVVGHAPPNTPVSVYFRFPSRSSDERSHDHDGNGSSHQTGRDGSRPNSTTGWGTPKPNSDSDTSLHPGFAKADRLSRIPCLNGPVSRLSVSQSRNGPLGGTMVGWANHRRARHPTLSSSHDTPFAGLISEESLRRESAARSRQDRQQKQRIETQRALSRRFYRPDTPRPMRSASEPVITPAQLIVHRSRGLPLRISNAALVGTPPGTPSDNFNRSTSITSKAPSHHHTQPPTPPENHHRLPTTGKNKPLPPPPRRTSITGNPSPPSSDAGSVIHYTTAQVEAEVHARAVKAEIEAEAQAEKQRQLEAERRWLEEKNSWQQEKEKSRRASESMLRTGTPSTLVEFDRHLRNSGALELNAYLDRHEDIHTASELSSTRLHGHAEEYAIATSPMRKLAVETTRAYLDRHEQDIPTTSEQSFMRPTGPARNRTMLTSPKRKLVIDTSSTAFSVTSPFRGDQPQIKRRREEQQGTFRRSQGYMQLPSFSTSTSSSDNHSHKYSTGSHGGIVSPRYRVETHETDTDTSSYDAHPPPTPLTAIRDPLAVPSTPPINFVSPLIPDSRGFEGKASSPLRIKDANKRMVANNTKNKKSEENSFKERKDMSVGREVGASDTKQLHMVRAGKPDGKENVPPSGAGYPDVPRQSR